MIVNLQAAVFSQLELETRAEDHKYQLKIYIYIKIDDAHFRYIHFKSHVS